MTAPDLIFAAHPDDETIAAGGHLACWGNVWIVHATDGAPRNMCDAHAHGFETLEAYASARRRELTNALQVAGLAPERALALGFIDQECTTKLGELVSRVAEVMREMKPATVLAPPYEGGHPDHDSLAFAVRTACVMLAREKAPGPRVIEHPLYHAQSGSMRTGEFLPGSGKACEVIRLTECEQMQKKKMFECFRTQQSMLALFATDYERFREAPDYDFTLPPHAGKLFYENFNWGVSGSRWRELAAEAARELEVSVC